MLSVLMQVIVVVALVSCASRVFSEAVEWFFFGRQTAPKRDEVAE